MRIYWEADGAEVPEVQEKKVAVLLDVTARHAQLCVVAGPGECPTAMLHLDRGGMLFLYTPGTGWHPVGWRYDPLLPGFVQDTD